MRRLREQRGAAPGTGLDLSFLDAAEAKLLLAVGDPEAARPIAARSAKHGSFCRLALARAKLLLGRPSAAGVQARRVLNVTGQSLRGRLEAKIVLACVALRARHRDDALVIARHIVELIRSTAMSLSLRTVAPCDRAALVDVLQDAGLHEDLLSIVGAELEAARASSLEVISLTPREQAVLDVLVETGALDEISARLFVSRNTVKSQLRTVYRKLAVSSREGALTRAAVLGLLSQADG